MNNYLRQFCEVVEDGGVKFYFLPYHTQRFHDIYRALGGSNEYLVFAILEGCTVDLELLDTETDEIHLKALKAYFDNRTYNAVESYTQAQFLPKEASNLWSNAYFSMQSKQVKEETDDLEAPKKKKQEADTGKK